MSAIIGTFFIWLMQTSWQAAILVLIVFLVQSVFGKKLNARWRHALWLLVMVRMLLPAAPRSAMSLFNYAGLENMREKPVLMSFDPPATHDSGVVQSSVKEIEGEPMSSPVVSQSPPQQAYTSPAASMPASKVVITPPAAGVGTIFNRVNIAWWCVLVWGIGAGLLALRVIGQNLTFIRRLRGAKSITEPKTLALFEQCKSMVGIHFSIGLVETSQVQSPALHGFFRPRLLLPARMIGSFSEQELRYIFLHELAHVKRCDMALLWAATLLKILHWFNPVLWLGFRRMATDRELACDEMALSHAGEQERKPYGAAIIKVLETCVSAPALPGVVGILEDKDQMSRRISMILKFRQRSPWSMLAIVLLLALGLVTLTDARSKLKAETEPAPAIANEYPYEWVVSGRVTDSDTHEPIAHFRVTPGYTVRNWGQTTWDAWHAADGANGKFKVSLDKRWAEPLLQVKAEGYLPDNVSILPLQQTKANLTLKKGAGPSGIVLLPDGKVAAGIGVLLICAEDHDMGLGFFGELDGHIKNERLTKTDADGRFSFAPEVGMRLLVAAAPEWI